MRKIFIAILIFYSYTIFGQDSILDKCNKFLSNNQLDSAESLLSNVLSKDSLNQKANSYFGKLKYQQGQFRKAIYYSLKSIKLTSKKNYEYYLSQYIVGYSYHELLSTEGLTYSEVDQMLLGLIEYIKSPTADNVEEIKKYIKKVKEIRPEPYIKKWQTFD